MIGAEHTSPESMHRERSAQSVMITGGSGFLGACLARNLIAEGQEVHLLLREGSNTWRLAGVEGQYIVHRADLCDVNSLRRAVASCRPEVIYHLASYGVYPIQKERALVLSTNLLGFSNLLDALKDHDYQALVNAGTCWE